MENKSMRILSLEGKDIFATMNLKNRIAEGYNIRKSNGEISLRKFGNTIDWSLDTIKLQEEYEKAVRKKDFYFVVNKRKYSQVLINVKFSYSYKEFNKIGNDTYVRAGYDYNELVFANGICVVDNVLLGIQTNIEVEKTDGYILPNYFQYSDGCYRQIGSIPVLKNKAELRKELYQNGFICDGIKYVRYKRSAGSSRVGKCLFVNEVVAKRMNRWDKCGLRIKENDIIDLSAYEAYIALPMSSIINTLTILPENILIVDDYVSTFKDNVIAVEEIEGRLTANEKDVTVSNCIWDGESLLDSSMFGEYADKGMLLLRNRFFKTCAFNANIQKWFADNGIINIDQLNGYTLANEISQIKLITTPSSVKYLKFGTIGQWLKNIESTFGIVKHEKETHFFDGRMVQCHYQLLNTLQLSYHDIETLLAPSLKYIGAVREDPSVLRYHIGYAFNNDDEITKHEPILSKNEIVFKLLGVNDKFTKTKIYSDFKKAIIKGFYRNLKRGHILLNGNYSTILGNGLELLQHSIGKFDGKSVIGAGDIHSHRFEYRKTVLGTRSPHVTMGNVLLANNVDNKEIDKYFNMTKEIVYINSINDNILQRLSGADMDSDALLLTDDKFLIDAARKNYKVYRIPNNCVKAKKVYRKYNSGDKADLDTNTSVNKIGEIINLSQFLNSLYWERNNKGVTLDDNQELYNDICKLAVLSGIEIDKAKQEFPIDSGMEINILKRKYHLEEDGKTLKPMFFKMITQENGYSISTSTLYRYFETPMDYLQRIINAAKYRQARVSSKELIPFMDIVKKPTSKSGVYNRLKDKIIDIIKNYQKHIRETYIGYDTKDKSEKLLVQENVNQLKLECERIVSKLSGHEYLMYLVLKELDSEKNYPIKKLLFEILFGSPNETFFKMITNSKQAVYMLVEDAQGLEKFYNFKFKRISKNSQNHQ